MDSKKVVRVNHELLRDMSQQFENCDEDDDDDKLKGQFSVCRLFKRAASLLGITKGRCYFGTRAKVKLLHDFPFNYQCNYMVIHQ